MTKCIRIENALQGCMFEFASSLRQPDSTRERLKVVFDITNVDVINVPQYLADPYRLTSISKITPLPAEINGK
jgi:hypothetical protein